MHQISKKGSLPVGLNVDLKAKRLRLADWFEAFIVPS
jgi:hypothetical protein